MRRAEKTREGEEKVKIKENIDDREEAKRKKRREYRGLQRGGRYAKEGGGRVPGCQSNRKAVQ